LVSRTELTIAGSRTRVEIRLRRLRSGRWIEHVEGNIHHWAEWYPVTVRRWRRVRDACPGKTTVGRLDRAFLRVCLRASSLLAPNRPDRDEDGDLDPAACEQLDRWRPGWVIGRLVRPVLDAVAITVEEEDRWKRQVYFHLTAPPRQSLPPDCQNLPVPDVELESALRALRWHETYGFPLYACAEDLLERELRIFDLVAAVYNEVQIEQIKRGSGSMGGFPGSGGFFPR
jgi:hypothetical protein